MLIAKSCNSNKWVGNTLNDQKESQASLGDSMAKSYNSKKGVGNGFYDQEESRASCNDLIIAYTNVAVVVAVVRKGYGILC